MLEVTTGRFWRCEAAYCGDCYFDLENGIFHEIDPSRLIMQRCHSGDGDRSEPATAPLRHEAPGDSTSSEINGDGMQWPISKRFSRQEFVDFAQQLQRFAETLPVGVAISRTRDASSATINPYLARMLGTEPGAQSSPPPLDSGAESPVRFRSGGKDVSLEELPQQLAGRLKQPIVGQEIEICRSDGVSHFILGSAIPILDSEDEVLGTIGIFQDVSSQVQHREGLELFGALLAHEIKSPITTILGCSYLLLNRRHQIPEHETEDLLKDLLGEARRLQDLTENMLFLSQVEKYGHAVTDELLVRDIVYEAVQERRESNPSRQITVEFPANKYIVQGRKSYLMQIIRNLLTNAEKYTPLDSPIDVIGRVEGDHLLVTVNDYGPGLDISDMPNIFEPFVRSRSAEDSASGSGIGLTVCRRLVEAQGGSIWCENREGGGAAFSFSLPLAESSMTLSGIDGRAAGDSD
jgi:signal transduction histidine kinase